MSDDENKSGDDSSDEIGFESDKDLEELKRKAEEIIKEQLSKSTEAADIPHVEVFTATPVIPLRPEKQIARVSSKVSPLEFDKYQNDKKKYISADNLLQMIRQGGNSFSLLDKVIEEIAEEGAALKFDREKNDSEFFDSLKASKTRSQILKTIGDLLVTKRELAQTQVINLHGKRMQAIFQLIVKIVKTSLDETEEIRPEQKELFFAKLIKNLEGFEDKAEAVMSKIEED